MSTSRVRLAQRRAQLLRRITDERATMVVSLQVWRQPLAVLHVARSAAHVVRMHPVAVAVGLAVLRLVLPRRLSCFSTLWGAGRRLVRA